MFDTIIIGAGPAGMMASINASMNNRKVLLIEKNSTVLKKLKLSGGTRCNLINLKEPNEFIKNIPVNGKFLFSTLNTFSPFDIYDYFNKSGIKLKVEDNDRVFPSSNSSQTIIDFLYSEVINNNVVLNINETVIKINILDSKIKEVITNKGSYKCHNIIIATGGKSYPHTGSTGDGYKFCQSINQPITKLYPADTFLYSDVPDYLSGITVDNVLLKLDKYTEKGSMLFTHFGVSGPVVFKISERIYHKLSDNEDSTLIVDFIPEYNEFEINESLSNYPSNESLISFLKDYLPKKLLIYILGEEFIHQKINTISKNNIHKSIEKLKNYNLVITKTGSIEQSFVTGGGVDLRYVDPKTMESKINPGIFFAGEILDIHGHTGGYNITIALSTGYTAGKK